MSQPHPIGQYLIRAEPYYRPTGDEVELYRAAYAVRMPMMLKGPTGCGKTRFVEYMAWCLGRPLITIACHEDMTASDLIGRHLLDTSGTRWQDGPLTLAVSASAWSPRTPLLCRPSSPTSPARAPPLPAT